MKSSVKLNKRFVLAVVVAGGLALAACGGSSTTSDTEPGYGDGSLVSELSGPTSTLPAPEVMPLTGLPIADAAASGRIGDGKIFIQPLDQAIRIRTGEEGDEAL